MHLYFTSAHAYSDKGKMTSSPPLTEDNVFISSLLINGSIVPTTGFGPT